MIRIPLFVLVLFATILHSRGDDHFLVIAGGQSAANNQVSLEKNVIFFRKVVTESTPKAGLTVFFSSGNEAIRSVQFESPEHSTPKANQYMARLLGTTRHLELNYRKHELGEVNGITSTANLNRWFEEKGKSLKAGDRLLIYATAHGGKTKDKKVTHNTNLLLWNRQSLDVKGLQSNLKKLPDGVEVVLVMAQCYSGGFSHSIFNDTDPKSGDFDPPVCGFFATVNSRESAGCTPDIKEENYDEFSSHFWAAIRGKDRMGNPVSGTDCDGDGKISLNEAYAYTVLKSRNIDLPMKTSGAFLRARSRFQEASNPSGAELLNRYTPYSEVVALADPVERRILEELSKRLKLNGEERYLAAEKKAAAIEKQRADLLKQFNEKKRTFDGHRNAIRGELYGKWPELSNLHTEQSVKMLREASGEFVATVESHPQLKSLNEREKEMEAIDEKRFQLDKDWAQYIRFLRAHNNTVLTENLRLIGNSGDLKRFKLIHQSENRGL